MATFPAERTRRGAATGRVALAAAAGLLVSGTIHGSAVALSLAANPDSYGVGHDTTLSIAAPGVLGNDVIVLGGSAVRDSWPAHGTLVLQPSGAFTYAPDRGYVGTDTFLYHAHDGLINTASATVTITISNAAPVAVDDTYSVGTGVQLTVPRPGALGNDTDADGDALTAILVDGAGNGSLDLHADGSFTFKSGGSFSGDRTFTYRASDGLASSNVATVTIHVGAKPTPTPVPSATPTPRPTLPVPLPTLVPLPTVGPLPTLRPPPTLPSPSPSTPAPSASPGPDPAEPGPTAPPGDPSGPVATEPGSGPIPPGGDRGLGFTISEGQPFGSFDGFDGIAFSGFEWAVPTLVLSVPGLLLLLALAAQAGVGVFSLPFVRRWLGAFDLRRRRQARVATG